MGWESFGGGQNVCRVADEFRMAPVRIVVSLCAFIAISEVLVSIPVPQSPQLVCYSWCKLTF